MKFMGQCRLKSLTPREQEIAAWVLSGARSKEIGQILAISDRTVEEFIYRIKLKTEATNKAHLATIILLNEIMPFSLEILKHQEMRLFELRDRRG